MLKRYAALCLLVVLISSNFSVFFVCAGFQLNSKYIAQNLCENKDKPWMHCNGHCYLMKKLKQAEEKEKKQQQEELKGRHQEALPMSEFRLVLTVLSIKTVFPPGLTQGTIDRSIAIFQPPKLVSSQA